MLRRAARSCERSGRSSFPLAHDDRRQGANTRTIQEVNVVWAILALVVRAILAAALPYLVHAR